MSSILLPLLLASFIAYQVDESKMKQYDMINTDGEIVKVQFSKNGNYSCPLSCSLVHHHYAEIDNLHNDKNNLWSINIAKDNNGFNQYFINGNIMNSYTLIKIKGQFPKQSPPIAFNDIEND